MQQGVQAGVGEAGPGGRDLLWLAAGSPAGSADRLLAVALSGAA